MVQPIRNWVRLGQSIRNWARLGQPIRIWASGSEWDSQSDFESDRVRKGQPIRNWDRKYSNTSVNQKLGQKVQQNTGSNLAQNDVGLYRSQSYWATWPKMTWLYRSQSDWVSFTDQSDCSKSLNHPTLLIRAQNHPTLLISRLYYDIQEQRFSRRLHQI